MSEASGFIFGYYAVAFLGGGFIGGIVGLIVAGAARLANSYRAELITLSLRSIARLATSRIRNGRSQHTLFTKQRSRDRSAQVADTLSDDDKKAAFRATLRAMPGYPWLPCPICHYEASCDHTGAERAKAAGHQFGTQTTQ